LGSFFSFYLVTECIAESLRIYSWDECECVHNHALYAAHIAQPIHTLIKASACNQMKLLMQK